MKKTIKRRVSYPSKQVRVPIEADEMIKKAASKNGITKSEAYLDSATDYVNKEVK